MDLSVAPAAMSNSNRPRLGQLSRLPFEVRKRIYEYLLVAKETETSLDKADNLRRRFVGEPLHNFHLYILCVSDEVCSRPASFISPYLRVATDLQ